MDFTRKYRWVKDGHRNPEPKELSYAGVVARDSVRIALTYAALNDVGVIAADIRNAYLQAPSSEKTLYYMWNRVWDGTRRKGCIDSSCTLQIQTFWQRILDTFS